jgi:MYXO-CTERM domain-containing protein
LFGGVAQAADFPLDQLPPHISLVLPLGERADWAPGSSDEFIYLDKPGGTPFVHVISTGEDREITAPGLNGGCWRIYHMADGNYLMTIGPDRGSATIHIVDKSGTVPISDLGEIAHEGLAVSTSGTRIAWTSGHEIHSADVVYGGDGLPMLMGRATIMNSDMLPTGDGTSYNGDIEPQNFRPPYDEQLIFSRYGTSSTGKYSAETWMYDMLTQQVENQSNRPAWYDEPEGVFPDGEYTLVECDMFLPVSQHAQVVDLYRMRLDSVGTDMLRLTNFGDVEHSSGVKFKANQGVVSSDGKYMLFGEGRSNTDSQPGSGFGIYLFDFAAAGIEVGTLDPEPGTGGTTGEGETGGTDSVGPDSMPGSDGLGGSSPVGEEGVPPSEEAGCGCKTAPSAPSPSGFIGLALGALAIARRRRSAGI